jgi:TolB-like protein
VIQSSKGVFLSYASEDAGVAKRICDALRSAGIEVWFDQSELRGGDAWDQKIRQQIRDCALFVPIISAHTQARSEGYFRLEWKLAVDRSHLIATERAFLVPVVVDATTEPEALVPAQFREVQWTRIQADAVPNGLVDGITALLNQPIATQVRGPGPVSGRGRSRRLHRVLAALSGAVGVALVIAMSMRGGWLSHTPMPKVETGAAAPVGAPSPTSISEKSIAVLPFVDMSEKKDQEYFADGLTEELIERLAQSRDLKVIARTSSFYYKERPADVRTIAAALGVRHVLEGSVRKRGNLLRITVQLIRASDGSHIWSNTYDRVEQDIFKVQEDIAETVTAALHAAMADPSQANRRRPSTVAAYELLLQADSHDKFTAEDVAAGLSFYRRAIAADPSYALAWARLSAALTVSLQLVPDDTRPGVEREAEDAANQALRIDSNLAYGHFAKGLILVWPKLDLTAGEDAFRRANVLQPGIADRTLAEVQVARSGDVSAAINTYRALLVRDPKYAPLYSRLGAFLFDAGRFQESEDILRKLLALEPGFVGAREQLVGTLLFERRPDEALSEIEQLSDADEIAYLKSFVYWMDGRRAESTALLRSLKRDPGDALLIARLYAFRSETAEAFRELRKAADEVNPGIMGLRYDRYFAMMRTDPRFAEILSRFNL